MPLKHPRRIFAKRRPAAAPALRMAGLLTLGFVAAFCATLVVVKEARGQRTETMTLMRHLPVLRVAAVQR